jgi:hypothetical protein
LYEISDMLDDFEADNNLVWTELDLIYIYILHSWNFDFFIEKIGTFVWAR